MVKMAKNSAMGGLLEPIKNSAARGSAARGLGVNNGKYMLLIKSVKSV